MLIWGSTFRLVATLAVGTFIAILAAAADIAPAAVAASSRSGIVLSPTAGQRLPAKPLLIEVRADENAHVRARLNGRKVGECICSTRGGIRKLRVSATHGLRHGRNVLRVSVRQRGSDRARTQKVVFSVRRNGPLAGAGRDGRVALHARFELDGTASILHPEAQRRGSARSFSWRVLRAPRGSALVGPDAVRSGRGARLENLGPSGQLVARRSATPSLRPDLPGKYRIQLEVRADDGTLSRDEVTLRVDPDPLVPIDTMAKPEGQKSFGVQVGQQFYPDPGDSKQWLQVVALQPDTLELIFNRSYDCPEATASPLVTQTAAVSGCVRKLSADLDALKPANHAPSPLVIAVSQPPDSGAVARTKPWQEQPPVGAQEILYKVGLPATVPWQHQDLPLLRGRMSAIGRFGGPATRHDNVDLSDLRDTGEIKGFLLDDNKGYYTTFESGEAVPFDTLAAGSSPTTSKMTIGSQSFTETVPGKESSWGGFHVLFVDRRDLSTASAYFDTGNANGFGESQVNSMAKTISDAISDPHRSGVLVFVQSIGSPQIDSVADSSESVKNAASRLVDVLNQRLGGTRSRAYRMLDEALVPRTWTYRLIARGGTSPAQGLEADGPAVNGLNGVPARGFLTRSSVDYGFDVEAAEFAAGTGAGERLREVALSAPGKWPENGNAGRAAAIAWVGGQIGLDTRRSLFWTHPYSADFWSPKVTKLQGLACPEQPQGFDCAKDFPWAKGELIDEIGWLQTAHAYVKTLAEPFARNQLSSWADVATVASAVNDKVQAPPVDKTLLEVGLSFRLAGELAEEIPVAGKAFGVVNDLYRTVLEWAKIDAEGTEAGEPFSVSVADAGNELVKRLQAVNDTLEVQLVNVIAADYQKLRTVGLCGGSDPACPEPPLDDWTYTNVDQGRAAPIVHDGIEASLYEALLPARYQAWAPPVGENRTTNWFGHQPAGQTILGWECPFHGEPATAQLPIPIRRRLSDKGPGDDRWQVIAYAYRTGTGIVGDPYVMHLPQASVTDRLFKAPSEGGLGMFPEGFYWRAFGTQKTFHFESPGGGEHEGGYPLKDSRVRWITQTDPLGIKLASCGY